MFVCLIFFSLTCVYIYLHYLFTYQMCTYRHLPSDHRDTQENGAGERRLSSTSGDRPTSGAAATATTSSSGAREERPRRSSSDGSGKGERTGERRKSSSSSSGSRGGGGGHGDGEREKGKTSGGGGGSGAKGSRAALASNVPPSARVVRASGSSTGGSGQRKERDLYHELKKEVGMQGCFCFVFCFKWIFPVFGAHAAHVRCYLCFLALGVCTYVRVLCSFFLVWLCYFLFFPLFSLFLSCFCFFSYFGCFSCSLF